MSDPLRTRLCIEYGCDVPIVAFAHTRDIVALVTNAGGIGVLGAAPLTAEELRFNIQWIRERVGDRPWGVDLLIPASFVQGNQEDLEAEIPEGHRDFVTKLMRDNSIPYPTRSGPLSTGIELERALDGARQLLDVVLEERVPIFVSGLGSPAFLLDEAHSRGVKVWGMVGLPRQAARQLDAGVDVIVAQGYDSGGHSGTVGTFTLVPEVVRMAEGTGTLVLAAGGVNNGRQVAAAIAMGADGVWTGTIWLATHESDTETFLKQRLVEARAEDPYQSSAMTGKPIRQLPSRFGDAWKAPDAPEPLPMPLQSVLVRDMLEGIAEARMEDWMTTPAGQSVVGIRSIRPASDVVFQLVEEAQESFERIGAAPSAGA